MEIESGLLSLYQLDFLARMSQWTDVIEGYCRKLSSVGSAKHVGTKQRKSGLGLEAQQEAVRRWIAGAGRSLVAEYTDVESGTHDARPQLAKAIAHAKKAEAKLLIAKLDRLSRKVSFVANLMDSRVPFVAVDNPSANDLTIHILAAVAQAERKAISERTSAALQAARARGKVLGNPRIHKARPHALRAIEARVATFASNTLPIIARLRAAGCTTLQAVANALQARGIPTARGGQWTATAVRRIESIAAVR